MNKHAKLEMTKYDKIQKWLTNAFQQPASGISEIYYFDKRDNEFFSILITDYFIFDRQGERAKNAITKYTKEYLELLKDRIKRIEGNDTTILLLPGLDKNEDNTSIEYISEKVDRFLNLNAINIDLADICEKTEITSEKIQLQHKMQKNKKKPWWKIW